MDTGVHINHEYAAAVSKRQKKVIVESSSELSDSEPPDSDLELSPDEDEI
jgi:hypothetical protein